VFSNEKKAGNYENIEKELRTDKMENIAWQPFERE